MIFALAVYGHPHSSEAPLTALRFARAARTKGHHIHRVFFYGDGVAIAADAHEPGTLARAWAAFAEQSGTELAVCVAAAQRRGISPGPDESHPPFNFVGLGQLAEAAIIADRVVTFPG